LAIAGTTDDPGGAFHRRRLARWREICRASVCGRVALAGAHAQVDPSNGAGVVEGLGLPLGNRHSTDGPEKIGIEADEALAWAIVAHRELIGLGREMIRAELQAFLVDAYDLKDCVGTLIIHGDAGLGRLWRLGEPDRHGQKRGKNKHQGDKDSEGKNLVFRAWLIKE